MIERMFVFGKLSANQWFSGFMMSRFLFFFRLWCPRVTLCFFSWWNIVRKRNGACISSNLGKVKKKNVLEAFVAWERRCFFKKHGLYSLRYCHSVSFHCSWLKQDTAVKSWAFKILEVVSTFALLWAYWDAQVGYTGVYIRKKKENNEHFLKQCS